MKPEVFLTCEDDIHDWMLNTAGIDRQSYDFNRDDDSITGTHINIISEHIKSIPIKFRFCAFFEIYAPNLKTFDNVPTRTNRIIDPSYSFYNTNDVDWTTFHVNQINNLYLCNIESFDLSDMRIKSIHRLSFIAQKQAKNDYTRSKITSAPDIIFDCSILENCASKIYELVICNYEINNIKNITSLVTNTRQNYTFVDIKFESPSSKYDYSKGTSQQKCLKLKEIIDNYIHIDPRERPEYVMDCAVDLAEEGFGDNI